LFLTRKHWEVCGEAEHGSEAVIAHRFPVPCRKSSNHPHSFPQHIPVQARRRYVLQTAGQVSLEVPTALTSAQSEDLALTPFPNPAS